MQIGLSIDPIDPDVPFRDYISALKKIHFKGDLIIGYQGDGNREQAVVQSKRYLEDILGT